MFTEIVVKAAKRAPPLITSGPKLWWSPECQEARAAPKRSFRQMKNPTEDNRRAYCEAKKTFVEAVSKGTLAGDAWGHFASTLNLKSSSSKVWGLLKSMDGRKKAGLPDELILHRGIKVIKVIPRELSKMALCEVRAALKKPKTSPMDENFSIAAMRQALRDSKLESPGEGEVHPIALKTSRKKV